MSKIFETLRCEIISDMMMKFVFFGLVFSEQQKAVDLDKYVNSLPRKCLFAQKLETVLQDYFDYSEFYSKEKVKKFQDRKKNGKRKQ